MLPAHLHGTSPPKPVSYSLAVQAVVHPELCAVPCAAALVIQGSACVYSKKVEYLHKLVYQALEFIAEKRCGYQHPSVAGGRRLHDRAWGSPAGWG